jgi:hypothetical protein
MHTLRRLAALMTAAIIAGLGLSEAAPSAFAMRLLPPDGGGGQSTAGITVIRSAGVSPWHVALITITVALVASIATAIIVWFRFRSRLEPAVR